VVPGVVSVTVRDTAVALDATHGVDLGAPYAEPPAPRSFERAARRRPGRLRIGFTTKAMLGTSMHPDNVAAVLDAVDLLTELGHELIEVDLPGDPVDLARIYLTCVSAGVALSIAATEEQTGRKPRAEDFELPTWFLGQVGRELTAAEHAAAHAAGFQVGRDVAGIFQANALDLHLSATTAAPPVRVGELTPSRVERAALSALRRASSGRVIRALLEQLAAESLARTPNTQLFNMTGQPAASVPLFWNVDGLPIGVQFAAKFGDEVTLLRLATQLESVRPWADRLPPLGSAA